MTEYALGRVVHHDPRSRDYPVRRVTAVTSKTWTRYTPILNQGNLGSCTGNACVGLLGTAPYYGSLYAQRKAGLKLDEPLAVSIYSQATRLDPFPGEYPPTDTGSSGLAVAKAAQSRGFIREYRWIFSLQDAYSAIAQGPFITGTNWYESMFNPKSDGSLEINGEIAGGHEYLVLGYSSRTNRWKCANSWGPGWGLNGYFYLSTPNYARLLSEQGDATVFVK